jgi:hypothetical protein
VWSYFQTNTALREQYPALSEIRDFGGFPDFDDVWHSAVKLDSSGDGYVFDPAFLSGEAYPYWEGFFGLDLVNDFRFWSNSRRPNIAYTTVVQKAIDDYFSLFITGLWPLQEVKTKLWQSGTTEPSSFQPFPIPRFTSETGDYLNVTKQISDFASGTWNLKFAVGDNSYGVFSIVVV